MTVEAYPLHWPIDWPRTAAHSRHHTARYKVTFTEARNHLIRQLQLLGARSGDIVLSTNIPVRRDGLPRAEHSEPLDPGVAAYWVEDGQPRNIACDHWATVRDNVRAVGLALDALRALKRSGATQVVARAYSGFAALPADGGGGGGSWRKVLGLEGYGPRMSRAFIERQYRFLVMANHPDRGGSSERMATINRAYEDALRELGGTS